VTKYCKFLNVFQRYWRFKEGFSKLPFAIILIFVINHVFSTIHWYVLVRFSWLTHIHYGISGDYHVSICYWIYNFVLQFRIRIFTFICTCTCVCLFVGVFFLFGFSLSFFFFRPFFVCFFIKPLVPLKFLSFLKLVIPPGNTSKIRILKLILFPKCCRWYDEVVDLGGLLTKVGHKGHDKQA